MPGRQEIVMQQWEYFRISPYVKDNNWVFDYKGKTHNIGDIWPVLNELGTQGWELVTALPFINSSALPQGQIALVYTYSNQYVLYFKRPKL